MRCPMRETVDPRSLRPGEWFESYHRCLHLPQRRNQPHRLLDLNKRERTVGVSALVLRCEGAETRDNTAGIPQKCRLFGRFARFLQLFEPRHLGRDRQGEGPIAPSPTDVLLPGCRRSLVGCPTVFKSRYYFPFITADTERRSELKSVHVMFSHQRNALETSGRGRGISVVTLHGLLILSLKYPRERKLSKPWSGPVTDDYGLAHDGPTPLRRLAWA